MEVKLKKAIEGTIWMNIEKGQMPRQMATGVPKENVVPAYPSSNKNKKNWD